MKRIVFALVFLLVGTSYAQDVPQTEISNGIIHAKIYLPDSNNGYYRASRFDWSGVIPELSFRGHSYFGQWFEKYDPSIHDAIMGPVDAFAPLDFDSKKPGDSFVKIGVGILAKPNESPYSFSRSYTILDHGQWEIQKGDDQVEFIHKLNDKEYSYEYNKTVQLIEGEPRMVIKHTLKNLGRKTMETEVYNHNFFVIDKQPIGPDFEVKFPFTLSTDDPINKDLAIISGNNIAFVNELKEKQYVFYGLKGFGDSYKDYDIRIENHKTKAGVRITSDRPLSKLAFWSSNKTLSPEPYTHIKIDPGEIFHWDIIYEFYTL
jgi:hypothetical protein